MKNLVLTASFLLAGVFFAGGTDIAASGQNSRYMAFCNDGDGAVSEWLTARNEAHLIGREHELQMPGHRWEVLVQHGNVPPDASCSIVSPARREGVMRVVNTCSECRTFTIWRKIGAAEPIIKEVKFDAGRRRFFRTQTDGELRIDGESDCSE